VFLKEFQKKLGAELTDGYSRTAKSNEQQIQFPYLTNNERETVEKLDTWDLKKAGNLMMNAYPQYRNKIIQKADLQARLNADKIETELIRRKSFVQLSSIANAKLEKKSIQNQYTFVTNDKFNKESNKMHLYELLLKKLEKKKKKESKLSNYKTSLLLQINKLKENLKIDLRNNEIIGSQPSLHHSNTQSKDSKLAQKYIESQVDIKKNKILETYEKQMAELRKEIERNEESLKKLQLKIESLKYEISKIREEQSELYHKLLATGSDLKDEGLIWIIKSIWKLGKNINLSKIPPYLDEKATEFLFLV